MRYAAAFVTVTAMGRKFKRFVIAIPNRAKYDPRSGEYVQSFVPKYRILESGDYTNPDADTALVDMAEAMAWKKIDPDTLTVY